MPKQTLKLLIPSAARIRKIRSLQVLGDWIYQTNLWHLNRYSASMAFFVGLFVAFLPIPGQMFVSALLAVLLKCNLPLSVGLVWVTNPVTMPALYFMAYKVGALIVQEPVQHVHFEMTWHWFSHVLANIWEPFLLGCLICGVFFGCLGYFIISLAWRWRVSRLWRERKRLRSARAARLAPGPEDPR